MYKIVFVFLALLIFHSCVEEEPTRIPKPRMYPKIDFPAKEYKKATFDNCPFTFDIPVYSKIAKVESDNSLTNDCWFNIDTPDLNAQIHCSYFPIKKPGDFDKFVSDSYRLVQEHNKKADFIDQHDFKKDNSVSGVVYNIEGPAASPFQFFLTDSTNHFMRGALYFNTKSRPDSIRPVKEFMQVDVIQMMNTLEWK